MFRFVTLSISTIARLSLAKIVCRGSIEDSHREKGP